MKLIGNYSEDVKDLIQGTDSYSIPSDILIPDSGNPAPSSNPIEFNPPNNYAEGTNSSDGQWIWSGTTWIPNLTFSAPLIYNSDYKIKLSVFQSGLFQEDYILEVNKDFSMKNNEIYLRPNELLDTEGYFEGNYTLQFDFIKRYEGQPLYLAQISSTRKEIRLRFNETDDIPLPKVDNVLLTNFLNENQNSTLAEIEPPDEYKFNSFIELSGGVLIPINNYAFDSVTHGVDGRSIILKLNTPLAAGVQALDRSLKIVTKFLETQTEDIYFVDKEDLATGNQRGLPVDLGYLTETTAVDDESLNYNELTEGSLDIISDLNQKKKDINLNIDFSKFENHVFFGSAETKLENFKNKAVRLEGLYNQLSASLGIKSTTDEIANRQNLFDQIRNEKETFTAYERFMYNDNQQTTINSAPGLGTNLAGNNFENGYSNKYRILSGSNAEGFEKLHTKTTSSFQTADYIHLFTDNFNVEQPPFFNTNDFVYLNFVLKNTGSIDTLHVSGGNSNISFNSDVSDINIVDLNIGEVRVYLLMPLVDRYYQTLHHLRVVIKDIFLSHNKIILDQNKLTDNMVLIYLL